MKDKLLKIKSYLPTNAALYVIILFVVIFSSLAPGYLTLANATNLFRQASVFCIITMASFLAILTHQTDLSVGTVASLTSVIVALLLQNGTSLPVAILAGYAVGIAFGVLNGILIGYTNIAPFIITFGTMSMAESIGIIITDAKTVPIKNDAFLALSKYEIFGFLPVCVLLMFLIYMVAWYVMNKRSFGTALYAIGGNEDAAKATGINVRRHKLMVYIINGVLATTAGLILAARVGTTNPSIGVGLEFEGICGAVLGGTALIGGRGSVGGAFLGAMAIAILKNGFNILGVLSFFQMVAIGSIIIIILVMDSVVAMRKEAQER